ncbi:hypothetical protein LJR289_002268 [Pseudoduganella sp. LjRoot289]|uniref:DUF6701 domain-containing protein n=1 Tax=Pseudoduganella sp. LjRoot289 TaxID=3342314 RepID=UPI003ECCBE90
MAPIHILPAKTLNMIQLPQMAAKLRPAFATALACLLLCVAGGAAAAPSGATTYNLPAALTASPFSCTLTSGITYSCGSISLTKDSKLNLTGDMVLNVSGTFNASKSLETVDNGYALTINTTGSIALQKDVKLKATLKAGGNLSIAKNAIINGNLTAGGSISIDKDGVINGNVTAGGSLTVGRGTVINGTCSAAGGSNYVCVAPATGLHHLRLKHDGYGVTCTGSLIVINACSGADADGSCSGSVTAVAGNLIAKTLGGAQLASVPFTIPANAGATSVTVQVTTPQTAVFSFANLSVTPTSSNTCWDGDNDNCNHIYSDSGFLLGLSDHISEQQQTLTVSAVKKDDKTLACTPAFADVTQSVNFVCSHTNPSATGSTRAVRIGDTTLLPAGTMVALNGNNNANQACDNVGRAINLEFNEDGVATTSLLYADSGALKLSATYAPANMTGEADVIVVPARFAVTTVPAPPAVAASFVNGTPALTAGVAFSAKVTALNNAGDPTPNFGKESYPHKVLLGFTRCLPSDGANGALTGTLLLGGFTAGAATSTNLAWSEVGSGELTVALSDATSQTVKYLGSALAVSGGTAIGGVCAGNVGPFSPAYFQTELTPVQSYVYSGQPMTQVTVTPYNSAGIVTTNYYGAFASKVTLTALSPGGAALPAGTGALSPATVAAADFAASGSASGTVTVTPTYTFTALSSATSTKPAPLPIILRAATSSIPTTPAVTSSGHAEAATEIRLGRLRLFNTYGSSKQDLKVQVQAQYWTGNTWLLNSDDSASAISASAIALSQSGVSGSSVLTPPQVLNGGKGEITLSKPNSGKGYVDLAINLGATTADQSCLAAHPATVGAALPWLRWLNGSCAGTFDRDPSARASFGVFSSESKATVHVRERFD